MAIVSTMIIGKPDFDSWEIVKENNIYQIKYHIMGFSEESGVCDSAYFEIEDGMGHSQQRTMNL